MSNFVKKRQAVTKSASENGAEGSSQEADLVTMDLASDERSSFGVARMPSRPGLGDLLRFAGANARECS